MRAIPYVVDPCPLRSEFSAHPVMQYAQVVFGEEAAGHAGLIREEEHEVSGVVQPSDCLRGVRHPANSLTSSHIAVVVVDNAVAVQESGGPGYRAGIIGAAHLDG